MRARGPVSGKKNRQEIEEIQKFIYTGKKANRKTYVQVKTASDNGLSDGSRVIKLKLPGNRRPHLFPPPTHVLEKFGVVPGQSEAPRHTCRQCRAGYLASCECVVKFPGNGALVLCLPQPALW